ncbi:2-hydroxychromene-2-carboxylate isomerase [Phenylobacterium sp.]|uniref:2-hydroxychromene-2-carboxylate isomerase n=1 Tax=Phenylobacterium sp. TaxID=1871053 RepID=UPI0035633A73
MRDVTLSFDLYWSFRSPYSYMVTGRLAALQRDYDVECHVRPVYPLAVRTPEFFEQQDPLWLSYFMTDVFREAEFLGLPFRWPRPDPVQRSPEEGYGMKQPHIHRLTHLGVEAVQRGRGLQFLDEVSRTIWGGEVDSWHEGDHLAQAAERAGLDFAEMAAAVEADPGRFAAVVEENQVAQRAAGHWGVPMMVFGGEAFFGQDRFDQLKSRMEAQDLRRR